MSETFSERLHRELAERYAPVEAQPAPGPTEEQRRVERTNRELRSRIEKARGLNRWTQVAR